MLTKRQIMWRDAVEDSLCRAGIGDQPVDIARRKSGVLDGVPGGFCLEIKGRAPGQGAEPRCGQYRRSARVWSFAGTPMMCRRRF